jgi:hypothetical protein
LYLRNTTNYNWNVAISNWVQGQDYAVNFTNLYNATYNVNFVSNKSGQLVGMTLIAYDTNVNLTTTLPASSLDK